jgi:hypothetical protein
MRVILGVGKTLCHEIISHFAAPGRDLISAHIFPNKGMNVAEVDKARLRSLAVSIREYLATYGVQGDGIVRSGPLRSLHSRTDYKKSFQGT